MPTTRSRDERYFSFATEEITWIEQTIADCFSRSRSLDILEAGCGRQWALNLDGAPYKLTGIDLSEEALHYRKATVQDLDVAIRGDLGTVQLDESVFDVIYCSYVLEHVVGVSQVLENFDRWARPGGLIVLRLPDRDTVVGLAARLTPHWSHIWYYKYLLKRPLAGKDGRAPFVTVYEKCMSRPELRRFFTGRGYTVVGESVCRPFPGQRGWAWQVVRRCLSIAGALSLGKVAGSHNNLTIIVRKPG